MFEKCKLVKKGCKKIKILPLDVFKVSYKGSKICHLTSNTDETCCRDLEEIQASKAVFGKEVFRSEKGHLI